MAKDRIAAHFDVTAAQSPPEDIYTASTASKIESVTVKVSNHGAGTITYRLYVAPLGAAHSEAHKIVDDETLSRPGSGESKPILLKNTDVIRAYADITGLHTFVGGVQDDI